MLIGKINKRRRIQVANEIPELYLEDKHADIQAFRFDDFHYSWVIGDNQLLTAEYIPGNWPCFTISIGNKTVEKMKVTLREMGFNIERGTC